jgi:hypothetical protein
MKSGEPLRTTRPIRSQKTGLLLPREGIFVRAVENLGRKLILTNFGAAGEEYLFPSEILQETGDASCSEASPCEIIRSAASGECA